jgi:predicted dehydrogenase
MTSTGRVGERRSANSGQLLRVGVLGLGTAWRKRYRHTLLALKDRFHIHAVCDPIGWQAEQEAQRLGCAAAAGPADLLENEAIDALLMIDAPWYGLWPIQLASRFRKPVFCVPALSVDDAHADELRRQIEQSRLPVMMALAPRLAPATLRLRALLYGELGPVRLVQCFHTYSARRAAGADAVLPLAIALIDCCLTIISGPVASAQTSESETAGLTSILLEFIDGRAAQVVCRRAAKDGSRPRLEVFAENGQATIELPNRVRWRTAAGVHTQRLAATVPMTRMLLECFHEAVCEGSPMHPNLDDTHRALVCWRAAVQSRAEGRRISLPATP